MFLLKFSASVSLVRAVAGSCSLCLFAAVGRGLGALTAAPAAPPTAAAPRTKLEKVLGRPPGLVGILCCWLKGVTLADPNDEDGVPGWAGGTFPVNSAGDWFEG